MSDVSHMYVSPYWSERSACGPVGYCALHFLPHPFNTSSMSGKGERGSKRGREIERERERERKKERKRERRH